MTEKTIEWIPKVKSYTHDDKTTETSIHPLGMPTKQATENFSDPLRAKKTTQVDALSFSKLLNNISSSNITTITTKKEKTCYGSLNLNWNAKKAGYLKKYSTNTKIPVMSTLVESPDEEMKVIKLEDRARMRVEEMTRDTNDSEYTSQKNYIQTLENLNVECAESWKNNDRVTALKIVIRCTKTLGKNDVPPFYPSLFVLVSEVLETFGSLVYQRIKEKGETIDPVTGKVDRRLGDKFTTRDVNDDAKETCRNWFYKIASIRELMPRIYVEMSLLPCNRFLIDEKEKMKLLIMRLAKSIRGIGDPLIAMYARLYLARKATDLLGTSEKDVFMFLFEDFMIIRSHWDSLHDSVFKRHNLTLDQYIDLNGPPLEWILEAIGQGASEQLFQNFLDQYTKNFTKSIFFVAYYSGV